MTTRKLGPVFSGAFVLLAAALLALGAGAAKKWPTVTIQAQLTNACLDLGGTAPVLAKCDRKQAGQVMEVIARKKGFALRAGKPAACLEALKRKDRTGADVIRRKCDFSGGQLWDRKTGQGQWFALVSSQTGKCLSVTKGKGKTPWVVMQSPCRKTEKAQQFRKF
jgi:hypothetical protein